MGAAAGEGLVPPSRCPNSRTKGGAAHLDMVLLCAAFEINPSLSVCFKPACAKEPAEILSGSLSFSL